MVAAKRDLSVSTVRAYKTYRERFHHTYLQSSDQRQHQQTIRSRFLLSSGDMSQMLHNDIEKIVMTDYPQVGELKGFLQSRHESLGTGMTGSGPAVFSLYARVKVK